MTPGVTIGHLDRLHLDGGLSVATRKVTWAWIGIYVAVPVFMAAATLSQRRRSTAVGAWTGVTFGALQVVALARHGDELDWAAVPTATYVVTIAALALALALALGPPADRADRRSLLGRLAWSGRSIPCAGNLGAGRRSATARVHGGAG